MGDHVIFPEIIKTLVSVIEEKDEYVRGHSVRVAQGCVRLAKRLNLPKAEQDRLFLAGLLHDIGMVYVPQELLAKAEKLSGEEMEIVKKHPLVAEKILSHLSLIRPILPIIKYHHERYDGSGYPDGLRGEAIPIGARILAIVDCYDALLSVRPHRPGKSREEAISEMMAQAAVQFDPALLKAFAELVTGEGIPATGEQTEKLSEKAREGGLAAAIAAIIEKVKAGRIELPVLPAVVMEIQKVLKSPIATNQDVAAAIEKDAVISLRLIATSNSSLYRGAKKVVTVREAVPRLGIKQTQSIVNAIANRGLYETKNEEFSMLMERLWTHSLATAYGARAIAKRVRLEDYEHYFTFGLVHDIGKVLMLRALIDRGPEDQQEMQSTTLMPLLQKVHTEFGGMLLERWGFSTDFKNVALLHEGNEFCDTTPSEVLVVNLANMMTRTIGFSLFESDGFDLAGCASARFLGMDAESLRETAEEVQKTMRDTPNLF